MDCPSTPAAPLFALTRLYASHTSCFGISNDLSSGPDLPTRLLPEHRLVARSDKPTDEPTPSLRSRYRSLITTTGRSASRCRLGTQRLTVPAAHRSSSRRSSPTTRAKRQYRHPPSHVPSFRFCVILTFSTLHQRFTCVRLPNPQIRPLT